MKRGANIFRAFCWGHRTGVDSERDARSPDTHAVKSAQVQAVMEPAQFCFSMQMYRNMTPLQGYLSTPAKYLDDNLH